MNDFKHQWDLQMALEVLQNPTIDSRTWSDAVKWLLLFGPPELREMLCQASTLATSKFFPELKPAGFTDTGDSCYDIADIARALDIPEDEIYETLMQIEDLHQEPQVLSQTDTKKIQ